jgi:hypothetical protein
LIEKPDMNNCTDKQWTKWWWQTYNKKCLTCIKSCKQSWVVRLNCPDFNKIEGVEIE